MNNITTKNIAVAAIVAAILVVDRGSNKEMIYRIIQFEAEIIYFIS
jgi:hypothetical protein